MMPALLTRMSTRPAASIACATTLAGFVPALEIRMQRVKLAARRRDAALGIRGAGARDADDVCAGLRERDRDALPQTGVRAGHERHLAVRARTDSKGRRMRHGFTSVGRYLSWQMSSTFMSV